MYTPKPYLVKSPEVLYGWIEQWGFGDLITSRRGKIEANTIPFVVDQARSELLGYMPRANAQWQALMMADDLVVIFNGPSSYASPAWYSQPDGNPDWCQITVQVSGKAELIKTESESVTLLRQWVEAQERHHAGDWNIGQMPEAQRKQFVQNHMFFRIRIQQIEGLARLSQDRSNMDRVGVMQRLSASQDSSHQSLARLIQADLKARRP